MRRRRIYIAALVGIWLISGCQQSAEGEPETKPSNTDNQPVIPTLPAVEPSLDRQALLLAIIKAASASALGQADTEEQRALDGKRIELRLRFGCNGPGSPGADETRGWRFDEKRRVLTLRVEPGIVNDTLADSLGIKGYEAVEGFWIRRPWLLSAACPVSAGKQPPEADIGGEAEPPSRAALPIASASLPPTPLIGIAQFYTAADARTHRRDNRAYTMTKVLGASEKPSEAGYDLVISGRLRRLADERVIVCRSKGVAAPPDCIVSAWFDSVAIEHPESGEILAKWSSG